MRQGEWSEWFGARVSPDSAPGFRARHVSCVCQAASSTLSNLRFGDEHRSGHPGLAYFGSLRIQPAIAEETGRYYTLGTPEDTSAFRQGVFNLTEFLGQSRLVLDDERRLLDYSLRAFRGRTALLLFLVVDQNSHMLWGKHDAELLEIYRAVDAAIGDVGRGGSRT